MKKKTLKERLGFCTFGLVFIVAGSFVLWSSALSPYLQSVDAKRWPRVEGDLVDCELKEACGDGACSLRVSYCYTYQNKEYHSKGLDFGGGFADDEGKRKRFSKLKGLRGKKGGLMVFVNPQKPVKSVLFPDFSSLEFLGSSLFSVLFILPGLAIFCAGLWPDKKTYHDEGDEVFILPVSKPDDLGVFTFALAFEFVMLVATFIAFFVVDDLDSVALFFVLLFHGISLSFLLAKRKIIFHRLRYKKSRFVPDAFPMYNRADLKGKVMVPLNAQDSGYIATLKLFSVEEAHDNFVYETLWQDVQLCSAKLSGTLCDEIEVLIDFRIPNFCHKRQREKGDKARWTLELSGKSSSWSEYFELSLEHLSLKSDEQITELCEESVDNLIDCTAELELKYLLREENILMEQSEFAETLLRKRKLDLVNLILALIGLGILGLLALILMLVLPLWLSPFVGLVYLWAIFSVVKGLLIKRYIILDREGLTVNDDYLIVRFSDHFTWEEISSFAIAGSLNQQKLILERKRGKKKKLFVEMKNNLTLEMLVDYLNAKQEESSSSAV